MKNLAPTDETGDLPTYAQTYHRDTFTIPGTLTTGTGQAKLLFPRAAVITAVMAAVGTAPTGASLIFDVNKNGTTIFTTQGNRPTITATNFTDLSSTPDVTSVAANDYLTVDIDQIGSTVAGADATVTVEFRVV
jgi:hypothetical protein